MDRFRSLPIARSAVLVGRTAADAVMNVLTLTVMLLVGVAVGFRPSEPVYDLALAFALVLAFSYVFSWISAFVGLTVRDPETAQSAGFIWVFPLTFVSAAFVPTSSMPAVLAGVRGGQPRDTGGGRRPGPDHRPRGRARHRPLGPSPGSPGCCCCSCPWRYGRSGARDRQSMAAGRAPSSRRLDAFALACVPRRGPAPRPRISWAEDPVPEAKAVGAAVKRPAPRAGAGPAGRRGRSCRRPLAGAGRGAPRRAATARCGPCPAG